MRRAGMVGIERFTVDWRTGEAEVVAADGQVVRSQVAAADPSNPLARSTYLPWLRLAHIETASGAHVIAEVPAISNSAPLAGRPTVYLDQNKWSTLANAIHDPTRAGAQLGAARRLIELGASRRVVLPLSSAHMAETTKWADRKRRHQLGLVMIQLSGGWQLRDPLWLRRFELRQAMTVRYRHRCLIPSPPISLEPNALHADRDGMQVEAPSDFPPDYALVHKFLTTWSATVATMLGKDQVTITPPAGWVEHFQRWTHWLASEPRDAKRRRDRTNLAFIADLRKEVAEEAHAAGLQPFEMSNWTRHHSDDDFAAMPSLGLFRECLRDRLLNPGTTWRPNDLTDLMYLTCAAGYADKVVAERHFAAVIANAQRRLGREVNAHRELSDVVDALE